MAEWNNAEQAKKIYTLLCQTLDKNDWKYEKNEEKLSVECSFQGDDLPMDIIIQVDAKRNLLKLFSILPYKVQQDKRLDVALAVCAVNRILVHGSFDYDVTSGYMRFRMTNSYRGNLIGTDTVEYLLYRSCETIDEFNDKFLMVSKGIISFEQFFTELNEKE